MSVAGFEAYNYSADVLQSLNSMGFASPSPLQKKVMPLVSAGRDFLCYTQAGSSLYFAGTG